MDPQYDSIAGSAGFMFDDPDTKADPISRFERALARYERVEQMKRLRAAGRDIFTGEPLRGEAYVEWLMLPDGG